jgi:hypothetical protein
MALPYLALEEDTIPVPFIVAASTVAVFALQSYLQHGVLHRPELTPQVRLMEG